LTDETRAFGFAGGEKDTNRCVRADEPRLEGKP
jgi:hypothetical protein